MSELEIVSHGAVPRDWILCFTQPDLITWSGAISTRTMPRTRLQSITRAVANCFGLTVADLKGNVRTKQIAYARHIAFYICNTHPDIGLSTIGRHFGRDHTTVLYGSRRIATLIKHDVRTAVLIKELSPFMAV